MPEPRDATAVVRAGQRRRGAVSQLTDSQLTHGWRRLFPWRARWPRHLLRAPRAPHSRSCCGDDETKRTAWVSRSSSLTALWHQPRLSRPGAGAAGTPLAERLAAIADPRYHALPGFVDGGPAALPRPVRRRLRIGRA